MYDPTDHYDRDALAAFQVRTVPLAAVLNAIHQAYQALEADEASFDAQARAEPGTTYKQQFAGGCVNGLRLGLSALGDIERATRIAAAESEAQ